MTGAHISQVQGECGLPVQAKQNWLPHAQVGSQYGSPSTCTNSVRQCLIQSCKQGSVLWRAREIPLSCTVGASAGDATELQWLSPYVVGADAP